MLIIFQVMQSGCIDSESKIGLNVQALMGC